MEHLKLLLGYSTTMQLESLDVVSIKFCSIPIKEVLFETKVNVLRPLSGKIQILSSAGQISLVRSEYMNVVGVFAVIYCA